MMRYLKILFMSLIVLGLMTSTVLAGAVLLNHGAPITAYTIAQEALGSSRDVLILGNAAPNAASNSAAFSYQPAQNLVALNIINVAFTGAAFTAGAIRLCVDAGVEVGFGTPGAGTTSFGFQLNVPVAAANYIWFTNSADCTGGAAANGVFPVRILPTLATGLATVSVSASSFSILDPAISANVARIARQYAITNTSSGHTVDYLAIPGNGTLVISGGGAPNVTADSLASGGAGANTVSILRTGYNYNTNGAIPAAGLTVSAVMNVTDSAAWQGISRIYLVPAATPCAIANSTVTVNSPSGTAVMTIPTAPLPADGGFNGAFANEWLLCIEANGTTTLQARTFQANVDIAVTGAGPNDPGASTFLNAQVWGLNAYQALIPWMVNNTDVPTYCLINNGDPTRPANVILDVVSSEGGVILNNQLLGSIPARTSNLAAFTANSASLTGGTAVALTTLGLGAGSRYSPRITVTANPANVSMTCNQVDPSLGNKRAVPVLTLNSPWVQ
jgi:hypothetical protein